jgi:glycosyltransferase involved in cell wall biosynthesis
MGKENFLVSVIIPAHNEERFIKETIDSILSQTYKKFEIIVVNDGSKDKTVQIVKELMKKEKRIKLVSFDMGHSAAFARNNGVKNAKGEIIIFQDADCFADKKMIDSVVKNINGGYDGVASRTLNMPPTTLIGRSIQAQRGLRWETHENKKKEINVNSGILVANMKKKCFESIGGFDELIFYFEDEDLTRRFFEKGYKAIYEPNARELHHDPDTLTETIGQSKHFGKGIAWKIKKGKGYKLLIYPIYSLIVLMSIITSFSNYLSLIILLPLIFLFLKVSIKSKDILGSLVFVVLFVFRNLIKLKSFIKNLFF